MILLPAMRQVQMEGEVIIDSGLVNVRNANLKLSQSKLFFQGDIFNPRMDIHLGAKVEDMDIHLAVRGTLDHPQLIVSSDPPMAPSGGLTRFIYR